MLHQPTFTPDWTADPRVRRILASCVTHPPLRRRLRNEEIWSAETSTYTGYRVECLTALWNEIAEPVYARCQATNDYEPWTDFCCQPTVDEAIGRATLPGDLDEIRGDVLAGAVAKFGRALAA